MTTQLDLTFEREAEESPKITAEQIEEMIEILSGAGWRTARELGAKTESQKRVIREIAEESNGHIISGQKGYKLTRESTVEEIKRTQWLKSQGKKMVHRWIAIQRVAHPILAGVKAA